MPRVAVVADSPLVRAGLVAVLGADAGVALVDVQPDSSTEARLPLRDVVAGSAPDVVVWAPWRLDDLSLAALHDDGDDVDVPHPAIVLVADADEPSAALRALRGGVHAVLAAHAEPGELIAAVHAAAAGLVALPAELAGEVLGIARGGGARVPDTTVAPLTPREREVLALLAAGLPNKAIAPRLDISEHTVKAHIAAIYQKLGAGNRAEAVVAAARQGLLLL